MTTYAIEKPQYLGAGTYGLVYAATLKTTVQEEGKPPAVQRQQVAMKTAKREVKGARASLDHEIAILQKLQHKNIVQYITTTGPDGSLTLIMEHIKGIPVHKCSVYIGNAPAVGKIAYDLFSALDYLARLSLVHRDLNYRNVLVTKDGDAKIIDFGTAGQLKNPEEIDNGCYYVRPPEVLLEVEDTPPRDMWAVGLLLYKLYTDESLIGWDGESPTYYLTEIQKVIGPLTSEAREYYGDPLASKWFDVQGTLSGQSCSQTDPFLKIDEKIVPIFRRIFTWAPNTRMVPKEGMQYTETVILSKEAGASL